MKTWRTRLLLGLAAYLIAAFSCSVALTVFLVTKDKGFDAAFCLGVYMKEKVYLLCLMWPAWPFIGVRPTLKLPGSILIPAAFLAAALLCYLALSRLFLHRFAPGHCLFCGYDLRATPDRCPECGTIISIAASNTSGT